MNVTDETYISKLLETLPRFQLKMYTFLPKWRHLIKHHPPLKISVGNVHVFAKVEACNKTPPPVRVNHSFNHLETWHTYTSDANLSFHSEQPNPVSFLGS